MFCPIGVGFGLVFKAREAVHIAKEIFAALRNAEDESVDKPVRIKQFFRSPNAGALNYTHNKALFAINSFYGRYNLYFTK
ncbi:MAG: hypothetical protein GY874_17345 [Desulfobacteraceae bacterium]|nr:hypothetical protein [Desulfobacteraceae bacterium]